MDQQAPDQNVTDLSILTNPSELGDLLRLANTIELLNIQPVGDFSNLWDYLRTQNFSTEFIRRVAKPFWKRACYIIDALPYHHVIAERECKSERRLTKHLLMKVRERMINETQEGPGRRNEP